MFVLDSKFNRIKALRQIRCSPVTIWATSSLFLFIDTFVYALTVANLPDILQTSMHASKAVNGVVTAMFGVGAILGSLVAGLLSDRFHKRRIIQLVGAVVYIAAGIIFYFASGYYHMLIFRLINGMASGIACTLLYTVVGDVYPANLLGFKVAIIYFCNNIAYTIGPICGQKLYELDGVRAAGAIVIALGVLEFILVYVLLEDSLVLRGLLQSHETPSSPLPLAPCDVGILTPHCHNSNASIKSSEDGASYTPREANNATIGIPEGKESHDRLRTSDSTISLNNDGIPVTTSFWRLFLKLPVLIATISIIVSMGIQCLLESVVPLHIDDLGESDKGGITFVIYGLALTILVPVIGQVSNWLIGRYGEQARYYVMIFGSLTSILTLALLAFGKTYGVMMVAYSFYAISNLSLCIPAQSSYGDFSNYLGADSMARSYAIASIAWSIGAIAFPPIGTALYDSAGFSKPTFGLVVTSCVLCTLACLFYPLREYYSARRAYR
ncbi:hypothetical protein GGI26_005862 [Coemansia sp. RSA 1358]|uniref:Major facilitator superfamily (MFS) profile domain-containing protein n=1 Tax=Coemansia umbellata TaxID=1424467 RepID=A0ABQ8PEQ5_9FUNG|nr:major facilitator superfamily domain-containing protein [Coemansia spiralis]KAJ1987601.1 hypothetical protein EDC05_005743 [Coemansia umbellata]KAJ2619401.1 hypothetical protein GGI26_005862 [Coemansia sp. RSA 1358]